MKTIGLVSCSKAKLDRRAPARELYSASDLFRKASSYCESSCEGWYILSAKYGLVKPDDVIDPYDVTLKKMSRSEQHNWGQRVARQLRELGDVKFEAHAGRDYVWPIEEAGVRLEKPLGGLSIGRRKRWYLDQAPSPS